MRDGGWGGGRGRPVRDGGGEEAEGGQCGTEDGAEVSEGWRMGRRQRETSEGWKRGGGRGRSVRDGGGAEAEGGQCGTEVRGTLADMTCLVILKELHAFLTSTVSAHRADIDQSIPELDECSSAWKHQVHV